MFPHFKKSPKRTIRSFILYPELEDVPEIRKHSKHACNHMTL